MQSVNNKSRNIKLYCWDVGLRTLVVATATVPEAFYEDWKHTYYRAATSLQNRQRNLDEAAELIERVCSRLQAPVTNYCYSNTYELSRHVCTNGLVQVQETLDFLV